MFRIDSTGAVTSLPTPASVGSTVGYFTDGNPGTGTPATIVSNDWLNMLQEELMSILTAGGVTESKTTYNQVLTALQSIYPRQKLTADLNLYVATTGSDSTNTGLTSGSPFLTLQHAANYASQNYDTQGYNIIVNVANGTYTAGVALLAPLVGGGWLKFVGNTGSPSSCQVNLTTPATVFAAYNAAIMSVSGFEISSTGNTGTYPNQLVGYGLGSGQSAYLYFNNMIFGACYSSHLVASGGGVLIGQQASYTISGGADQHAACSSGALIILVENTVTLTGTPAFDYFVWADASGVMEAWATTYTGSATGSRYYCTNGGYVSTNGGGANYFPGNSAGSVNTGTNAGYYG